MPSAESALQKSAQNFVWLDCEMTGLNPETDRILEIAVVVTDPQLEHRTEGPVLALHQNESVLGNMDKWNQNTHRRSGLIDRVKVSTISETEAQATLLKFLEAFVPPHSSPLCGNSIGQDRRFLTRYMPQLESFFHYRNLDVSTLKELAKRWAPDVYKKFKKMQRHTALADVHEAIDELEYYRLHFIRSPFT